MSLCQSYPTEGHAKRKARVQTPKACTRTVLYRQNPTKKKSKKYNTTLWISLPDEPGQLGSISSLIGVHRLNISNLVMAGKNPNYINFKFQLIIKDLKNFKDLKDFLFKSFQTERFPD